MSKDSERLRATIGDPPGLWSMPPLPERIDGRLAAERLALLQAPPQFDYPIAQGIRRDVMGILDAVAASRVPPPRLLLAGPSDNGRTTLVRMLAAALEHERRGSAWLMTMPGRASCEGLWDDIRRCADPHAHRPRAGHAAMREIEAGLALTRAAKAGLRLVVIEGADCLRDVSPKTRRLTLHALAAMGEKAGVTIMLVGSPALAAVLAPKRERSGRYEVMTLPRWRLDHAWVALLTAWDEALPLRHRSGLGQRDLGLHLYALSDGRLGALARVIQGAANAAIERGDERNSIGLLDDLGFEVAASFTGFWF